MYILAYTYTYIYTLSIRDVRMHILEFYMYICVHTHTYVCILIYMCAHTYIYVCALINIQASSGIMAFLQENGFLTSQNLIMQVISKLDEQGAILQEQTYIHLYIHICTYINIYIYIYICTSHLSQPNYASHLEIGGARCFIMYTYIYTSICIHIIYIYTYASI